MSRKPFSSLGALSIACVLTVAACAVESGGDGTPNNSGTNTAEPTVESGLTQLSPDVVKALASGRVMRARPAAGAATSRRPSRGRPAAVQSTLRSTLDDDPGDPLGCNDLHGGNFCGDQNPFSECWCDNACSQFGFWDCCPDKGATCGGASTNSCFYANACGGSVNNGACWCDSACNSIGDCCPDKVWACGS